MPRLGCRLFSFGSTAQRLKYNETATKIIRLMVAWVSTTINNVFSTVSQCGFPINWILPQAALLDFQALGFGALSALRAELVFRTQKMFTVFTWNYRHVLKV
ncbi:MAG: hypothetical protein DYG98_20245 [Haliscomenobacteraceae bacterium CHB4]|nr:hypothetical protein [Saprospiraceae bacterium]MCE7925392.1 hypothetical protein [Haliscomenobacteraceae bacterium CHB4]